MTIKQNDAGLTSLPDIDPEFIVVCASAWMNDHSAYGINYSWDGKRFNNRADAIKHGWKLRGSDDFNIAQTYGDDLIWFGWMDQRIDEAEDDMRDIAKSIDLSFDPRWYRLEFSKATGRVTGIRAALTKAMTNPSPDTSMEQQALTREERLAIASFKRLAKRWPDSLWLFAGSGGVHILRAAEDGSHIHIGENIDQDFVVDHIDIPADGGDW